MSQEQEPILDRGTVVKTVTLNVGGTRFEVAESTISAFPDSMLAALLRNRSHGSADEEGSLFICRDPALFSAVLCYMRTLRLVRPEGRTMQDLVDELDYYQLHGEDALQNATSPKTLLCMLRCNRDVGAVLFEQSLLRLEPQIEEFIGGFIGSETFVERFTQNHVRSKRGREHGPEFECEFKIGLVISHKPTWKREVLSCILVGDFLKKAPLFMTDYFFAWCKRELEGLPEGVFEMGSFAYACRNYAKSVTLPCNHEMFGEPSTKNFDLSNILRVDHSCPTLRKFEPIVGLTSERVAAIVRDSGYTVHWREGSSPRSSWFPRLIEKMYNFYQSGYGAHSMMRLHAEAVDPFRLFDTSEKRHLAIDNLKSRGLSGKWRSLPSRHVDSDYPYRGTSVCGGIALEISWFRPEDVERVPENCSKQPRLNAESRTERDEASEEGRETTEAAPALL